MSASPEHAQMLQMQAQMQQMHAAMQQQSQQLHAALQAVASSSASSSSNAVPRAPELPKIRQPTAFNGSMGFAVDDWLSELQQQFAYYGARFSDDATKIRFAVAYLTGAAMHWWEHQPAVATWLEFVSSLHGRFRPVHAAMLARQRLGKLRQRAGQSVNQYVGVFQNTLTPIIDMGDMDQVHQFVNGLLPPVAAKVWEKHPLNLVQAIDAAVSVEAMHNFGRAALPFGQRQGGAGSSVPNPDAMDVNNVEADANGENAPTVPDATNAVLVQLAAMDLRLNALMSASSSSRGGGNGGGGRGRGDRIAGLDPATIKKLQAEGRCFRCKKPGHMKNECPDLLKSKNE